MSTTTAERARAVVAGRTLGEIARAEIGYALRSPVLWLGAVASAAMTWLVSSDGTFDDGAGATDGYALWEWAVGPLALAAFLVANWAALRERPSTTAELLTSTPARRWDRTLGVLVAAVVPALLALLLQAAQYAAVLAQGGVRLGEGRFSSTFAPTPLELLGGPLAVACSFVAGVAVARVIRSRAVGAVLGFLGWLLLFVTFWIWLTAPFGVFAVSRSSLITAGLGPDPSPAELDRWAAVEAPSQFVEEYIGIDRDLGFYGWHLTYVVGVTVALAGLALLRSGPDRRSWRVLAVGLVLAAAAVAGQFLVHDGAGVWMGLM